MFKSKLYLILKIRFIIFFLINIDTLFKISRIKLGCTSRKNRHVLNKIVFLLAEYFVLGEGELLAELVLDDEGEAEAEHQVGEREVEDEDVPAGPHGLVGDHGKENHHVVHN